MSLLAGLDAHAQRLAGSTIAGLVESDQTRARDFALRLGPLYASFARQRYDREALDALFAIAAIVLAVVVYFYYRSKQMNKEVRLIRRNLNTGSL